MIKYVKKNVSIDRMEPVSNRFYKDYKKYFEGQSVIYTPNYQGVHGRIQFPGINNGNGYWNIDPRHEKLLLMDHDPSNFPKELFEL